MLKQKLEEMRQKNGKAPLVCLHGDANAKGAWLAAGGTAGHMLSKGQMESALWTGAVLPEGLAFEESLAEFIRLFPMQNPEESRNRVNHFLEGGVAEWNGDVWEYYTCRTAVLGCCMGEYLSVVNRKDV